MESPDENDGRREMLSPLGQNDEFLRAQKNARDV